nr:diacylglycerol O-acyltransferase 1 [Tanacetum cinerariifolium]
MLYKVVEIHTMASSSKRRENAKATQPWTTAEEIMLCTAWCNAMDKYGSGDITKKGFWSDERRLVHDKGRRRVVSPSKFLSYCFDPSSKECIVSIGLRMVQVNLSLRARHVRCKVLRWWELDVLFRISSSLKVVFEGVCYVMSWSIRRFRNRLLFDECPPHTPEIAEPRAEIRRRTTAITDAGNGLYNDSMTSSSSNGESDTKENETNEEQIGARDETRDDGKKKKKNTVHYAYRPSTPAHRKIKESPLSSDAIFKQFDLLLTWHVVKLLVSYS